MTKTVTSVTLHTTAEGQRLSYTYSELDDSGRLINSNKRESIVVLDTPENSSVLSAILIIMDKANSVLTKDA